MVVGGIFLIHVNLEELIMWPTSEILKPVVKSRLLAAREYQVLSLDRCKEDIRVHFRVFCVDKILLFHLKEGRCAN